MYKKRMTVFLSAMGLVFIALIVRMGYLQIVRGDEFRREAELSLQSTHPLPAMRGRILDRNARILAIDELSYDFCMEYRFLTAEPKWARKQTGIIRKTGKLTEAQAKEVYRQRVGKTRRLAEEVARSAGKDFGETVDDIVRSVGRVRRAVERIHGGTGGPVAEENIAHAIVTGLERSEAMELREKLVNTVGASVRPSHRRLYPYADIACHVIGITGQVTHSEQDSLNLPADRSDWLDRIRDNYLPGDVIGKRGVEKMCEKVLRGRRGYRRYRRPGFLDEEVRSEDGGDVHVTLDVKLQQSLTEMLRATGHNGSIVVLSVPQAEVLALVSTPTFDLNHYRRDFARLATDGIDFPLRNRAISRAYPPGSTIKPVAALAGLGSGAISLNTTFHCRGYLHEPTSFRCWIWRYKTGHGDLDVVNGIKNSCNVYFYNVGERLGPIRLADWYRMFGLGQRPGTGLPEEVTGRVPTEEWVRRVYRRGFVRGDARFMAIGQGLVTATPLQVANAMATVAREGLFCSPTLVLEGGPPRMRRRIPLASEHARAVIEGMNKVVNERGGTAYKTFHAPGAPQLDVAICGKTGTAEAPPLLIDDDGDGKRDRTVYSGDMAWFAGFAPYGEPQIALAVVVEYVAGGGARNAGPIARETVRLCQKFGYVR